jgi:hypothetical protein
MFVDITNMSNLACDLGFTGALQAPKTSRSNREFELYPNTRDFLSYLIETKYIQRKLRLRTRG